MRILIAEDERITRTSLARQLTTWGHDVTSVEDGALAWKQFSSDGSEFDIVITDWEMPNMSGLELVAHLRSAPRSAYTYVILLTSRSEKADIVRGIEAGADDYLSKPFDRDELRVRLLAGERIVRLERTLSRQNAELRDANERIRTGLRAAARVQRSMLPRQNVITPHVRTAWTYVPTDELAGDAIGLHLIDDRYLVAYVLDVSGHGVPAALLSVSAMHSMEPIPEATSMLRDMTRPDPELGSVRRPCQIATELNRAFRAGENDGRYFTMFLCVLDTYQGKLRLANAGHPPPFLMRGAQNIALPDSGGVPIAILDDFDYEEAALQLHPGDRLYMYSDGVIEQTDPTEQHQFGLPRVLDFLTTHNHAPAQQVLSDAVQTLAHYAGSRTFTDDVSLLVVEWLGRA